MGKIKLLTFVGVFGVVIPFVSAQDAPADWPSWAYARYEPITAEDFEIPARSGEPPEYTYPGTSAEDPLFSLPDGELSFADADINNFYGPADWYPAEHPEMPEIVAKGDPERGIRACAFCHFANGQGKTENAHLSGLPVNYFVTQLKAFVDGSRFTSDPRKPKTYEMTRIARMMTEEEMMEAAEYFAAIPFKPMMRVIESETAPQVQTLPTQLVVPIAGAPWIPLGNQIVEVPEDPYATEALRDPHTVFISYVPIGSVAKGKTLVETGGGKTIQCAICHGPGLKGLADIPGIAGRTASYNMRQMWDVKQGTRASPLMSGVVAGLSSEDMLNIVAYIATLEP